MSPARFPVWIDCGVGDGVQVSDSKRDVVALSLVELGVAEGGMLGVDEDVLARVGVAADANSMVAVGDRVKKTVFISA